MAVENTFIKLFKEIKKLKWAIDQLSPRERKIIKYRFGFNFGRTKTLEEVAKKFGVTRERIRQLEAKAVENLIDVL